jgi:hypothetical protein
LASLESRDEESEDDQQLPVLTADQLAPGWDAEDAVLCIGGRTPLDAAAAAMLAGVLQRQGLEARAAPSEAISAGQIISLGGSKTKLACLSYIGAGAGAAHVRYLVRRLRRILPAGATVIVGYWGGEGSTASLKALQATAEADAYATTLREAALICIEAARGEASAEAPQGTEPQSEKPEREKPKSEKPAAHVA